jgi:RimJ/RimL family protein N-acetyltransferase
MSDLPVLETERLVLRPFSFADEKEVQRLAGDRDIAELTSAVPHPYEDGMAEAWIATHEEDFKLNKSMTLAITIKSSESLVGAMSLLNMSTANRRAELGYWVGKEYWCNGFASEAARLIIAYGFRALGLHRVHGRCLKGNKASSRVMEKAGMRYEGCHREHECKGGRFEDILLYGALNAEWHSRQPKADAISQVHSSS